MIKKCYALLTRYLSILVFPLKVLLIKNSRRVRVLIICKDSVLLVKSSIGSQKWSLPGGGIEKNEEAVSAAVREVYEETSVRLKKSTLKNLGEYSRPIKHSTCHYRATFFVTNLPQKISPKIIRPLEILDIGWFSLSALPPDHSDTVATALKLSN